MNGETAPRMRKWPSALLFAVLIATGLFTVLVIYRAEIAERAARYWLDRMGIPAARVSVESIGLGSVRLEAVSLGDAGPSFESAEIAYSIGGLLDEHLGDIVIRGLDVTVDAGNDGFRIRGIPRLGSTGDDPAAVPALPFESARLEDFELRLKTDSGVFRISGDAALDAQPEGSVTFAADLAGSGAPGSVSLTASGELAEGPSGAVRIESDFEGTATAEAGAARFAGSIEAISGASGELVGFNADLTLDSGQVSGMEITESRATLAYENGQIEVVTHLNWDGGALNVHLAPSSEPGDLPYAIELEGSADAGWLSEFAGSEVETSGMVRLALEGTIQDPISWVGSAPITPGRLLHAANLRGLIGIDLGTSEIHGFAMLDGLTGALVLRLAEGRLDLHIEQQARVEGMVLSPELLEALPEALRELAGSSLMLSAGGARPVSVTVSAEENGASVDATIGGKLSGADATITLGASIQARIDENFGLEDVRSENIALSAADLPIAGMTAGGSLVMTNVTATDGGLGGEATIDVTASGSPTDGVRLRNAALNAAGGFELNDEQISFRPRTQARFSVDEAEAGRFRVSRPVRVTFEPGPDPEPLIYDFRAGLKGSLHAGPLDIRLAVAEPNPLELAITSGMLDIEAQNGTYQLSLSGGQLELPSQQLAVSGLEAHAALNATGEFTARVNATEVTHEVAPPWFVPLKLSARVDGTMQQASFGGELFEPGRRLVISLEGTHSLETGHGRAEIALEPITFIPTVLQLRQLFPASYRFGVELDGRFEASGRAEWGPGGIRSSGAIDADVVALSTGEIEVRNASTTLRFDSLAPPSTEPGQSVSIAELNVGLPLTDGLFRLELHPDGRLTGRIEQLSLFGGRIITKPFTFDPNAPRTEIELNVKQIDLAEFLAFAEIGEVEATGTLHGTIPIVVENGEVSIENAALETTGKGGVLKYRPSGLGDALEQANEVTDVLVKAIRNFHYSRVRVLINETSAEEMSIDLILEGTSPDVYGGLPLVLNVNISGPLREILGRGLETYQLPGELGRELEERTR